METKVHLVDVDSCQVSRSVLELNLLCYLSVILISGTSFHEVVFEVGILLEDRAELASAFLT